MASHILGIDGGGTTTRVMIADELGRITHGAQGEGCNPLDNPNWQRALEALLQPFASSPPLRAVAAALPAHGEVAALSLAQAQLIEGVFGNVPQRLLNDVDAAQIGAFGGGAGILLLSGTGSMAWARDMRGRSHRTGGWGDVIGDEGSAHWMGQRILSAATQDLDGRGPRTGLTQELFRHLQLDPKDANNQLEGWASSLAHPRSGIAALAPLATQLAESGDAVALAIVEQAADELARHVSAFAKLFAEALDWSYAGGSFASPALLNAVTRRVGRAPVDPHLPPIGGALLAAAKLADWPVDSGWIARLGAALRQESVPTNRLSMTA